MKNTISSFTYYFYNDEKRFSINTSVFYIKSQSIFNTESTLTNDFNFATYKQTNGGESYNFNFSFINYIRKLKLASKIETTQMWSSMPINANSNEFLQAKNYNNTIKYSATTCAFSQYCFILTASVSSPKFNKNAELAAG